MLARRKQLYIQMTVFDSDSDRDSEKTYKMSDHSSLVLIMFLLDMEDGKMLH